MAVRVCVSIEKKTLYAYVYNIALIYTQYRPYKSLFSFGDNKEMSFEIAKGSIETNNMKLADSSKPGKENPPIKIYIINNKDYNLSICAIIEGVCDNIQMEHIDDAIDYEYLKKKPLFGKEEMKFDVLIYGRWKRENYGKELEVMVKENLSFNNETKRNVWTLSRQLLNTIKATFKKSTEKELIFCLECGCRLENRILLMKHGSDFHDFNTIPESVASNSSDALIMHLDYEKVNECHLLSFKRTDWLEHYGEVTMPFLVPSFEQITESVFRKDADISQSPPLLSMLPSWTTTESPCQTLCNICDTSFSSGNELEEHMKQNHPRSTTPSSRNSNRHHGSNKEYRCNICNYKTITKGNLHIHFQSEKHRNNQREHDQNEQKSRIHSQETAILPQMGSMPPLHLFDNFLSRPGNFFTNIKPPQFSPNWAQKTMTEHKKEATMLGAQNESSPVASFECDICHNYSHQDPDVILEHAERPRPLPNNSEVSKIIRVGMEGAQGTELEHLCLLDGYKTRIKANFLLHFKTEKHQQKLQLLAHAREGGMENANKMVLQMVTEPTPLVNIRCSLCRSTFSTAHKLRLHVDSSDHQMNQKISVSFRMWQKSLEANNNVGEDHIIAGFECKPCGAMFRRFIEVLDHFQNQRNNIHMAFFKKEVDINSLVKINYFNRTETVEPFKGPDAESMPTSGEEADLSLSVLFRCYLCNDAVSKRDLRNHLKEIHKIQENCVDQLIKMAVIIPSDKGLNSDNFLNTLKISTYPNEWCDCVIIRESDNLDPMVRCQQCGKCFATVALLEEHRIAVEHTEIQDSRGHLCYKKGCNQYFKSVTLMTDHFYEIHAFQISEYNKLGNFKYICKVCHLMAFSDPLKYAQHVTSHSKFKELDCTLCGMINDCKTNLRKHIESTHVTDNDNIEREWKSKSRESSRINQNLLTNISPTLIRGDSQSSFSSPESIINKENRNLLNHIQECSTHLTSVKSHPTPLVESSPPFLNSWASVSSLINTVGLENVKLVIETMINSKYDQNEKDSLVWKFAESIINVANIQETLVEKCEECGKRFSSPSVLLKHVSLCTNSSQECVTEFERTVALCRDHLTRMMLSLSSETNRKPLFISMNSHSNDIQREETLIKMSQQYRPQVSSEEHPPGVTSKFSNPGLLNFNRSIFQPIINPYRFPQTNHSFLNIIPPLGMFPQFRFTSPNSTVSSGNLGAFASKIQMSSPLTNNGLIDSQKLQDPLMKSDNFNRKRTQIKNYQYEILRSYFNINNPPNDETIAEIISKTGLDKKTVKHWFRNTLFKERQRCKDSPYNFSIPPETSLNVEEYEKTGKVEIKSECVRPSSPEFILKVCDDEIIDENVKKSPSVKRQFSEDDSDVTNPPKRIKSGNSESNCKNISESSEKSYLTQVNGPEIKKSYSTTSQKSKDPRMKIELNNSNSEEVPLDLSYQTTGFNIFNGSRSSLTLDPVSPFESEQEPAENSNSICGERRHRTTLTAMQIQAMKSIFIHCRSPTHGELGALGNFLSLDMRVVQVWFQNQRAKLKKQERDMFYREKPLFPEAIPSVVDLPKCDRCHCLVCNQNLSSGVTKQSHLFSTGHLTMLMRCLLTKSHDMKISWNSVSEANSL